MSCFRQRLLDVSDHLEEEDLQHLKHLCSNILNSRQLESFSSGYEYFDALERSKKLGENNLWFLADFLIVIGKHHLLDLIGLAGLTESDLQARRCQLTTYRLYLTKLAMELDDEDVQSLKLACDADYRNISSFYDVVFHLEHRKKLGPLNLDFLYGALKKANLSADDSKVSLIMKDLSEQLLYENECYRMTSRPRGICIIINNKYFQGEHKNRAGTKVDGEKLRNLFHFLNFQVEVHNDLTAQEICSFLQEVSQRNHSLFDCFICCILSHGSLGKVYGIDGIVVSILDLLKMFFVANCPSLEDKPKLFFIQACQGQSYQKGLSPSASGRDSSCQSDVMIEDEPPAIENLREPDLLLGYSTPPGYKSYRSREKGSWYIQKLVKNVSMYADSCSLLDILTVVNNEVAKMEGTDPDFDKLAKQTPCPRFSLGKKLFLSDRGQKPVSRFK